MGSSKNNSKNRNDKNVKIITANKKIIMAHSLKLKFSFRN